MVGVAFGQVRALFLFHAAFLLTLLSRTIVPPFPPTMCIRCTDQPMAQISYRRQRRTPISLEQAMQRTTSSPLPRRPHTQSFGDDNVFVSQCCIVYLLSFNLLHFSRLRRFFQRRSGRSARKPKSSACPRIGVQVEAREGANDEYEGKKDRRREDCIVRRTYEQSGAFELLKRRKPWC
jgi:hypothetical protein